MSQKSYNDTPTLFLVPTPIGNLEDITYRALKTLESVDVIFSEDTRVTSELLRHFNIKNKVYRLEEHNEEKVTTKVIEFLNEGKNIAIASDRGTPIISDPGFKCTREVIKQGFNVVSLPGATALIPALTSSGIEPSPFLFYGFLNSKTSKAKKELEALKNIPYTLIIYEAPHRILETLDIILNVFGNRYISVSREISKKFEEIYRGNIEEVANELKENVKGEFVIVIEGSKDILELDFDNVDKIKSLIDAGMSEKDAIKEVAHLKKINKNEVYQEYLKSKER